MKASPVRRLHVAVFEREVDLLRAIGACRDQRLTIVDAYSPYPIHGIDEVMGIRRSRLTLVCFAAGLTGLTLGLLFQYWSSAVDWPLDVGGRPFDSLPAFIPVAFEMTVLFGGLATALALLARSRLWPGRRPRRAIERVTDDRFALVVAGGEPTLRDGELERMLADHGAASSWEELER